MKKGIKLEHYFSGDKNWQDFVEIVKPNFKANEKYKEELLSSLDYQLDIAIVVYFRFGDDSLAWIHRKVPALDKTPVDCLRSPELIKRLKEALLRMP